MSKDSYLKTILTLIALLLAGLLWTQVAERSFADSVQAQIRSGTARTGIVTREADPLEGVSGLGRRAIAQRQTVIDELTALRLVLERFDAYVRSGKLLVQIENTAGTVATEGR